MRLLRLPVLLALTALASGCRDEGPSLPPEENGRLTGVLDVNSWRGDAQYTLRGDTLTVYSRRWESQPDQDIGFRAVRAPSGAYALHQAWYGETRSEDIHLYSAWWSGGTLNVTSADLPAGRVTGSVTLTVQGSRGTWEFEGEFDARPLATTWHSSGDR